MANWNDLFGGGGLIMPQHQIGNALYIKNDAGVAHSIGVASFWSAIDVSHTDQGYESVSLTASANTTEQTIVDVSGSGVVTQAVASVLSSAGIMTIRVTIDGTVKTFTSSSTTNRLCIGAFIISRAATTGGSGLTSENDYGYTNNAQATMLTPNQALTSGMEIGLVFKESLKVTIQGSVNITGTAESNKAVVCYTTSIPEGL